MSMRRSLGLVCLVPLTLSLIACEKKQPPAGADSIAGAADTAANAKEDVKGPVPLAGVTEVLFGEVGSLTGQEATFGVSTTNGIKLAVQQLNDAGGLGGKKIRVITYDNQGKPTEAAAATTKLILQDKVHVILGEVASSRSLAMAPIAQDNQVPMVSPSSTNPKVTEGKDFVFRVCFIDPFQGRVMAKFARETLKATKVAILRDVRNDYSVGLANYFTEEFTKDGAGKIVADASYSAGDVDFKSQLTALRGAKPEAIFVPGYYTDVGLIARQARELGLKAPLLGGDGWESDKLFEIGGAALEGSFYSNHYAPEDPSPRIQEFVREYQKMFGVVPDSMSALAYDAAKVAAAAIVSAQDVSGPKVREAIAKTQGFAGVTGDITLGADRNAVKPAVILEIKGGKAKYLTTIAP